MTIERKVGMGIAGQPSGDAPDVAEVFSTHLYNGTGSTGHDIVNGIDLDGEGGLVWIKSRTNGFSQYLFDTESGVTKYLNSTNTNGHGTDTTTLTHFNSTGFSLADSNGVNSGSNRFTSWTFRKKAKFFDIVTYSGNSTSGHTVSHSLGSVPAMMIIKQTNGTNAWFVYHKDFIKDGAAAPNSTLFLHLGSAQGNDVGDSNSNYFNNTAPTDSVFTLGSAGGDYGVNGSGENYVAYLFADNTAEDADDQMIKCGGFTDSNGGSVNLGWEPQWIIVRRIDVDSASTANGSRSSQNDWVIADNMRNLPVGDQVDGLLANTSAAEFDDDFFIEPTPTGFNHDTMSYNGDGKFIYMAIRAPMMKEPEAATDVFDVEQGNASGSSTVMEFDSGFPVDFAITHDTSGSNHDVMTRLMGRYRLRTQLAEAQADTGVDDFDSNIGYHVGSQGTLYIANMWKRAKGFFDVVGYTGDGVDGRAIPHSLGVAPEMIWLKRRDASADWPVYHKGNNGGTTPEGYDLRLNTAVAAASSSYWSDTAPTSSSFTVGASTRVNGNGNSYIAYLFASLDGISKVGSYTGNGSSQTIDCGFSAGARFVLIKRTNATGNWMLFDTIQGIVAGNDPYLYLDNTGAQVTNEDAIDPHSSGFIINQTNGDQNISSATYIFYAIA